MPSGDEYPNEMNDEVLYNYAYVNHIPPATLCCQRCYLYHVIYHSISKVPLLITDVTLSYLATSHPTSCNILILNCKFLPSTCVIYHVIITLLNCIIKPIRPVLDVSLLEIYLLFFYYFLVRRPLKSWSHWGAVLDFFARLGNISFSRAWSSEQRQPTTFQPIRTDIRLVPHYLARR